MNNRKAEKRKKKLADRRRRENELAVIAARRAEFPEFVFDDTQADPEFAVTVREAVRRFDFAELPAFEQTAYKVMREKGAAKAMSTLRAAMAAVRAEHPQNQYAQLGDIAWQLMTGELIFAEIPEPDRQRFFPLNDFRILLHQTRIVIQCSSLIKASTPKGPVFHSRFRPTVEFEGKKYVVAFTPAVIQKIQRRLLGNQMNYAILGDVYGYFELCIHFEPCTLRGDGDRRDELGEAITFYEDGSQERYWNNLYVKQVLGPNYDPANGTPYYRVGYCPVRLDGELAVAVSFLPPGFKKTPEYAAISLANLPVDERQRLEEMATDEMALVRLIEKNRDFSAIRCFHANGVPQVIQTHEEWFRNYQV